MFRIYDRPAEFSASLTLLPAEEGGRKPPPYNGIRWNFCLVEDYQTIGPEKMVVGSAYPEFLEEDGTVTPRDVPISGTCQAYMHLPFSPYREETLLRLKIGTQFFSTEGSHIVARGIVTALHEI